MSRIKIVIEPGKRFGSLKALRESGRYKGHVMYDCVCDCGKEVCHPGFMLRQGRRKSCGCMRYRKVDLTAVCSVLQNWGLNVRSNG